MTAFDIYVLVLCLIVFISLTALFSYLIAALIKLTVRLVKTGVEDERIKEEYGKARKRKAGCLSVVIDRVVSVILCCVLFAMFAFSLYVNFSGAPASDTVPTLSARKKNHDRQKRIIRRVFLSGTRCPPPA